MAVRLQRHQPGYRRLHDTTPALPRRKSLPIFVSVAPRILRLDDLGMLDPDLRARSARQTEKPAPDPQLPGGRDAGVFRPLAPDNRDRAVRPMPPEAPRLPAPKRRAPVHELPRPAPPAADPKAEGERQLNLGREAFAAREYGRATQRFRDAARRTPDDPLAAFPPGPVASFAAGRYPEAVAAIQTGVGLAARVAQRRVSCRATSMAPTPPISSIICGACANRCSSCRMIPCCSSFTATSCGLTAGTGRGPPAVSAQSQAGHAGPRGHRSLPRPQGARL